MSWIDPPPFVAQLRTQLLSCAAFTAAGSVSGDVHFPAFDPSVDLAATKVAALLTDQDGDGVTWATGALPLLSGSLDVDLYVRASDYSAGQLEALARTLCDQLLTQGAGIPFRAASRGQASDPTGAAEAAGQSYRHLRIRLSYGLTAP